MERGPRPNPEPIKPISEPTIQPAAEGVISQEQLITTKGGTVECPLISWSGQAECTQCGSNDFNVDPYRYTRNRVSGRCDDCGNVWAYKRPPNPNYRTPEFDGDK